MSTPNQRSLSLPPLWMVLLLLLLPVFLLLYDPVPISTDGLFPHWGEGPILRTTPDPGVAIELSDSELMELDAAYNTGFDNPDPEGNDPCERLRLLPYKKLSAWRKQFSKRGFTIQKIKDILRNGRREIHVHPEKGTAYTKIFDPSGNWIVVDFVDCVIWQVAPHNFK